MDADKLISILDMRLKETRQKLESGYLDYERYSLVVQEITTIKNKILEEVH